MYNEEREGLENLIFTGCAKGKRGRGKHQVILMSLQKWMAE